MSSRVWKFAVSWLILFALYLLLVGKFSPSEIFAGALAAAVAASAATAVRVQSGIRYEVRLNWLRHFASVPWKLFCDCFLVLGNNCRRPFLARGTGRLREWEFNPGNDHPASKARRALVSAAVSLAPNSFVVGVDRENHRLLVHELVPAKQTPRDPEWPL